MQLQSELLFHQLFEKESSTYSYLLADSASREAVLIDSVLETSERDLQLISELELKLVYVLDTHIHADHVTAAGKIRTRLPGVKSVVSRGARVDCADLALADGEVIKFGRFEIRAIATPGHTDSCMSYHLGDRVFTGDALLIRGCGRTDFQQGSSAALFESVRRKLFSLPDATLVFPAHDYRGLSYSTIGLEKKFNPRLGLERGKEEFVKIMSELKLDLPKKIHEVVPANMACGKSS